MISARQAFDLHTKEKKLGSAGVWGVSVKGVLSSDSLSIESDPIQDPSHSLINFSKLPSESRALSQSTRTRVLVFP